MRFNFSITFLLLFFTISLQAQNADSVKLWHNKSRNIHYKPEGKDFVLVNGKMRFNRALYGTNTGFRVETGDLPEFALYMPGMGGNLKFGLIKNNKSKWLIDANAIKTIYRPGSMIYEIKDSLLGNGVLQLTVLALADAEGMIVKTNFKNIDPGVALFWVYGGASGKKFSRDGDIGADPESSFYLKAQNCTDNIFQVKNNAFTLFYGNSKQLTEEERYEVNHLNKKNNSDSTAKISAKTLTGVFPENAEIHLVDANQQQNPIALFQSKTSNEPVIAGKIKITETVQYFLIQNPQSTSQKKTTALAAIFDNAESARKKLAERVNVNTPDEYINTLGAALTMAGDAIWEDPSYMHGAVAWRMRLNAWRGPYVADPMGWHDRAKRHFSSYALSQLTSPDIYGVVADTALHLARQLEKIGTSLFSDGYICRNPNGDFRAHHYDMNLVFIDQLINHFNYTGDIDFVKKMFPLIKRHLAWEKKNFDADGDGLYDAYAAIWASDALQYSGGGVTHSSAYNYKANQAAADLAKIIGEDPTPFLKEANHILSAMNKKLWMPEKGWYAEYKDILGNQLLHPAAGLWTIYHAIDSKVPDAFQAYQCLKYIDASIPHIPVKAKGLPNSGMYVLSTTNWQPYTWSLNNVTLAENLHTALAYWQSGSNQNAFKLWRSAMVESLYLSASPGGFEQLSFYDGIRGELYRDFGDPIGMAARSLVEGLFGVNPDLMHDSLTIQPGFPAEWSYANLSVPDISLDFKRTNNIDGYNIIPRFGKKVNLKFKIKAISAEIDFIKVNGKKQSWTNVADAIDVPMIELNIAAEEKYLIEIGWKGLPLEKPIVKKDFLVGEAINIDFKSATVLKVYDPQKALTEIKQSANHIGAIANVAGNKTFFMQIKQSQFVYWQAVNINVKEKDIPVFEFNISSNTVFENINLEKYFNDKVTNIFKQQYLSPRVSSPTLQLPTQGIGNWCYPLTMANIDDAGLRKLAATNNNQIITPTHIPFTTPADSNQKNILFTSQWDNYPKQISIPLSGAATQINLLMAGSTNAMQSRMVNAQIIIKYTDGSFDTLLLKNPENWWPIEQDYYIDGYAFTTNAPTPLRLYLKEGKFGYGLKNYTAIKGFSNMSIDGGAATVLNFPLNKNKSLESLSLQTIANDVVVGIMAITLNRN